MTGPAPPGGPGREPPLRGADLRGDTPLGGIEERVLAVLPARSLVTVTCCRGGVLALAEIVAALNVGICHSFTGRPTRTKAVMAAAHT